jgi:ribonuclease VapC
MFVDASAMAAMLTDEPEGDRLARVLEGAKDAITSAIAIYETAAR